MKIACAKTMLLLIILGAFSCQDELNTENNEIALLPATDLGIAPDAFNLWQKSLNTAPRYDGSDSGPIGVVKASAWMENFNRTVKLDETRSHYFDRNMIDKILSQTGCTGIRIYLALNNRAEKELIISGADSKGNNILPASLTLIAGDNKLMNSSGPIGLANARTSIENFKKTIGPDVIRSHYFGLNVIGKILAQKGCTGIRIYYAVSESGENKLIIVGTDGAGMDMLPNLPAITTTATAAAIVPDFILADFSFPCPSVCPPIEGI